MAKHRARAVPPRPPHFPHPEIVVRRTETAVCQRGEMGWAKITARLHASRMHVVLLASEWVIFIKWGEGETMKNYLRLVLLGLMAGAGACSSSDHNNSDMGGMNG